jgi:hypothetical protein
MKTYKFGYVLTLSTAHFIATSLFTRWMAMRGKFEPKRNIVALRPVVTMALAGTGSIALMNFNLQTNTVRSPRDLSTLLFTRIARWDSIK